MQLHKLVKKSEKSKEFWGELLQNSSYKDKNSGWNMKTKFQICKCSEKYTQLVLLEDYQSFNSNKQRIIKIKSLRTRRL